MTARLLTVGVSHYCEKARWALDRAGVPYVEEAHAPFFHLLGGRGTRPRFIDGAVDLGDSTEILRHLDAKLDDAKMLYPATIGASALDLEERYDEGLGIDVRRVVYGMLAREPEIFGRLGAPLGPAFERRVIRSIPRLVLAPIVRAYRAAGPPPKCIARVEAVFAEASEILKRQPYLAGDRFSAADLTFASLAAPAVFPERHPAMPAYADLAGTKVATFVTRFRDTRAGEHVLRMYREQRHSPRPRPSS